MLPGPPSWPTRVISNAVRFDGFAQELEVLALGRIECAVHHTRAGNAHVDNRVALGHAVETAGHKRVVVRHVAEGHELDAAVGVVVGGTLGNVFDDMAEQFHRVHVDAGFRGADVHGRAGSTTPMASI